MCRSGFGRSESAVSYPSVCSCSSCAHLTVSLWGHKHGLEMALLLNLNRNPNLRITGIYKESLKEAKLLVGKTHGLAYLLIFFKFFFLGDWKQVFLSICIPVVPTNGTGPISLCCCIAIAPSSLGRSQSPGELQGASPLSCSGVSSFTAEELMQGE